MNIFMIDITFQGMKVLKLYAWEKPLMQKVIDRIILNVLFQK